MDRGDNAPLLDAEKEENDQTYLFKLKNHEKSPLLLSDLTSNNGEKEIDQLEMEERQNVYKKNESDQPENDSSSVTHPESVNREMSVITDMGVTNPDHNFSIRKDDFQDTEDEEFEVADEQRDYSATSFHQAARDGNVSILSDKIANEFIGKRKKRIKALNWLDGNKMSPLHYAAKYGRVDAARLLVEHGANLFQRGDDGCLPIHLAVKYRPDVFASSSAEDDVDTDTIQTRQRVMSTSNDGFIDTLNFLIEKGLERDPTASVISEDDAYGDAPLHYAVYRNNVEAARILLNNGADINDVDNQKQAALHMAATNGSVDILALFIDHKAVLSLADNDGATALQLAVAEGHTKFVQLLLKAVEKGEIEYEGATGLEGVKNALRQKDSENSNVLHYAVEAGDANLMRILLRKTRETGCKELINLHKSDGDTALHLAAEEGSLGVVQTLCRYGAKIDTFNRLHETPVYVASKNNRSKIVAYILDRNKESMNKRDADGWSPLLIAASFGHIESTDVLLKHGVEISTSDKNDQNVVYIASLEGQNKYLEHILAHCQNPADLVNARDVYHNTALHIAAENGHLSCVNTLLRYKAKADSKNDEEQTPMHRAAQFGKKNVIAVLARKDLKLISDWDENNDTPLHVASTYGRLKCVRDLINLGAQVDTTNTKGWTPLDCAAAAGSLEVCKELVDNDAPLDPVDKSQTTPLHLACKNGHLDVVKYLLGKKANMSMVDVEGRNALDFAIDYYHEDVVEVILKSDDWKEALSNAIPTELVEYPFITPMRKLIQSMPEQAEVVLNRCMEVAPVRGNKPSIFKPLGDVARKTLEAETLKVKFNYDFMDDDFIIMNQEWDKTGNKESTIDMTSLADREGGGEDVANVPYVQNRRALMKNHPLNYLVEYEREDLITHPLVVSLYSGKWSAFGFRVYYSNLAVYILFMTLLNIYAFTTPPPFSLQNYPNCSLNDSCVGGVDIINESSALQIYGLDGCYIPPGYRGWMAILVIILALFRLLLEVAESYNQGVVEYIVSFTNLIELCCYVLAILFVWDFGDAGCGIVLEWQWQCGAVAIWLSWMVLLLFIQKVPIFGIYVLMFLTVVKTFFRFIVVFALFILGFSFSFYMLLQNQIPFDSFAKTLVKSIVMMIGEYEYEGIFENFKGDFEGCDRNSDPDCPDWSTINFYHQVAYVMFVAFMIVMTIIVTNMLVGLAVDDIKGVQDNAILRRQALKIQMTLQWEYKIPNAWRQSVVGNFRQRIITLGDSTFIWYDRFMAWLDPETRISRKKIKELQHEDHNEIEEVWEAIEEVNTNMKNVKHQVRSVDAKISRVDKMLVKLLRNSNIEISDESDADN